MLRFHRGNRKGKGLRWFVGEAGCQRVNLQQGNWAQGKAGDRELVFALCISETLFQQRETLEICWINLLRSWMILSIIKSSRLFPGRIHGYHEEKQSPRGSKALTASSPCPRRWRQEKQSVVRFQHSPRDWGVSKGIGTCCHPLSRSSADSAQQRPVPLADLVSAQNLLTVWPERLSRIPKWVTGWQGEKHSKMGTGRKKKLIRNYSGGYLQSSLFPRN